MQPATIEPATFLTDKPEAIQQITEAVHARGSVLLRVRGGSMAPSIRPGDILFIVRAELARVARGQVVLFAREGRLYAHRVIHKQGVDSEKFLVTKGDTLPNSDAPISNVEFLGRVERIHRGRREIDLTNRFQMALGRVLSYLSSSSRVLLPAASAARRFARSFAALFQ